jgi:hypothetical protein
MSARLEQELELLRRHFPTLEYVAEGHWIRLPGQPLPPGLWNERQVDICFQVPPGHPGQKPYGFYVRPQPTLANGAAILNTTQSSEPPFPGAGAWLKFSWDVPEWNATSDIRSGSNLLNYALTFQDRLTEGA